MKEEKNLFLLWIIILFFVTFTCSLTYLVTQQALRLSANELPVRFTTDTAIKLQNGKNAEYAIPSEKIDISKSMDTFVMIFDNNKNLIATSGMMGNIKPSYPNTIFDTVYKKGESRVTWQPQVGLRFATVAVKYNNGYIVAARSLHETEKLIDKIGKLVLLAWFVCFICLTIALLVIYLVLKKIDKIKKETSM